LQRRREELSGREESGATLQERARHIARHARFRAADEAVPESGSVTEIFDIKATGAVYRMDANLLGENFFRIGDVLSR
jgi:hypothetical protein